MNNISKNNKRILEILVMVSVVALASACSPVRFSQGSKNDSSVAPYGVVGPQGPAGPQGPPGSNGAGYGGTIVTNIVTSTGTYSAINIPYSQIEAAGTNGMSLTDSYNINNLSYNVSSNSCSYQLQVSEQISCDPEIDPSCGSLGFKFGPTTNTNVTAYKNGTPLNPTTSFSCAQQKKAQEIRANGACTPVQNIALTNAELDIFIQNPALLTTVDGADSQYILLQSVNPMAAWPNPLTLNLDSDCRCYYHASGNGTLGGTADVKIPALPSHCAAHHLQGWQ